MFLFKGWTPAFIRLGPNTVLLFVFFEVGIIWDCVDEISTDGPLMVATQERVGFIHQVIAALIFGPHWHKDTPPSNFTISRTIS